MGDKCIRCGRPADHPVRALEVLTLHVRSLSGERRVQALGDEITAPYVMAMHVNKWPLPWIRSGRQRNS